MQKKERKELMEGLQRTYSGSYITTSNQSNKSILTSKCKYIPTLSLKRFLHLVKPK
jgi:hypothetical protein